LRFVTLKYFKGVSTKKTRMICILGVILIRKITFEMGRNGVNSKGE
jgi:hypothetical protein